MAEISERNELLAQTVVKLEYPTQQRTFLEAVISPELLNTTQHKFTVDGGMDDDCDPSPVFESPSNSVQIRIVPKWNGIQGRYRGGVLNTQYQIHLITM